MAHLDKDRQAALAKEKQSELVALRGKWFKERTRLYDRETGLPTVAVLVDDLRNQLAERGSISVLVFRPSSEGHVEEVWGWEAYDDLLLDFVRRRFVTYEWRWIKGELSDGKGGFCLLGAVIEAAQQRLTTTEGALPYLARAITPWRAGWNSKPGMHTVITFHNDNSHSFVDVMGTLAKAKLLAEADAESG